jgi:hypothetical protein
MFLLTACEQEPQDPAQSPQVIRQALIETITIDPLIFDPRMSVALRNKQLWVAQTRHKLLFEQLARIEKGQDLKRLQRRAANDFAARLSYIALDRAINPQWYQRIEEKYLRPVNMQSARQISTSVDPADLGSEARTAWEYFLLLPYGYDARPGYLETAMKALARIGDPASILVMRRFIHKLDQVPETQFGLISGYYRITAEAMLNMPSRVAAEGLLDMYRQAEAFKARGYRLPEDWFITLVTDYVMSMSGSQQMTWLTLADQYPDKRLFAELRGKLATRE